MLRLGAQCFCDRGESDEQHPDGIDGLYLSWSVALRERLLHVCPLPPGLFPIPEGQLLPAEWILQLGHGGLDLQSVRANGDVEKANQAQNHCTSLSSMGSRQSLAKLISNQRLTPDTHWQDVRLFEFSIPPTTYCPGDVFTIYPKNPDEDVNALINLMQWNGVADEPVTLIPSQDFQAPRKALASPPPFLLPKSINLRELIQSHFDLNAVPRRSFFATIAQFTADEMQKARLIDFTKPELVDELYDYTTRPRRSILEVLQEFDTVKIPLEWAIAVFPRIRGRQFSIASGGHLTRGLEGDTRVQILVAIVKYRTVIKKVRRGLCTRYLSELELGSNLEVGLSRSGMAVALNKPAIMIGPGTGVAPLRAMVHERAFFTDGASRNEQVLFFGGRNRNADFFFGEEWKVFEQDLELRLWTAFSRDQVDSLYIQLILLLTIPSLAKSMCKTKSARTPQLCMTCSSGTLSSTCVAHLEECHKLFERRSQMLSRKKAKPHAMKLRGLC